MDNTMKVTAEIDAEELLAKGEVKAKELLAEALKIDGINAELLLAKAESKARELLAEAAIKDEQNHRIRLEETSKIIVETMNTSVNGKVDGLRQELKNYIATDNEWKESDRKWKESAQPVVSLYAGTTFWGSWLGKNLVKLAKLVILVGATFGAWTVIRNFFNN